MCQVLYLLENSLDTGFLKMGFLLWLITLEVGILRVIFENIALFQVALFSWGLFYYIIYVPSHIYIFVGFCVHVRHGSCLLLLRRAGILFLLRRFTLHCISTFWASYTRRSVEYRVPYSAAHVMTVVYLTMGLTGSEIGRHGGCGGQLLCWQVHGSAVPNCSRGFWVGFALVRVLMGIILCFCCSWAFELICQLLLVIFWTSNIRYWHFYIYVGMDQEPWP
jgi:hypothetical protein